MATIEKDTGLLNEEEAATSNQPPDLDSVVTQYIIRVVDGKVVFFADPRPDRSLPPYISSILEASDRYAASKEHLKDREQIIRDTHRMQTETDFISILASAAGGGMLVGSFLGLGGAVIGSVAGLAFGYWTQSQYKSNSGRSKTVAQ